MRDLELWRRIASGEVTAAELAPVAEWSLARRAAHLGRLAPLVGHPDPQVRAAALATLAGVRGVPGVRALVTALDDPDARVWRAALDALRATARDAPGRYVHALFHEREEIRLAALEDVPRAALEAAAYLRADPACAQLAGTLPWPDRPLPLAFDLHRGGTLASAELLTLVLATPPTELRGFLEAERGRDPEVVEAYFAAAEKATTLPIASGDDVLDQLARAFHEVPNPERAIEAVLEVVTQRKKTGLVRRTAAALLSRIARAPSRHVVMACAALEPRVIELPGWPRRELAAPFAAGLIQHGWPVRPTTKQVIALLALPEVREDLAVAVAVAGLFTNRRLGRLIRALGEATIIESLVTSGAGWQEICRLPQEKPPIELRWLAVIERVRPDRHAVLAGIALGTLHGPRLEAFVEQMQRKNRHAAFLALVGRPELSADDARLIAAARAIAPRVDRSQVAEILTALLAPEAGERGIAIALVVARALDDKQLASAAKLVDDAAAARLVLVLDGFDALPRDRELALAQVFAERAHPEVKAWAERVTRITAAMPPVPLPAIRARRELDAKQRAKIQSCDDHDLEAALHPALLAPVTGLVQALGARRAVPSVAACAALLGCADPLVEVARQLDRFAEFSPRFAEELDNAAIALWRTGVDLPPLAHARLWRWEAHTSALLRWVHTASGMLSALRALDALPGVVANETLWKGLSELVMFTRYRDRERFLHEGTPELAAFAAERVDRPVIGRHAARIAVSLVEGGAVALSVVKPLVLDRTADAEAPTRELLARLVRLDGMPEPPRAAAGAPAGDVIATIKACRDLDQLVQWCMDPRTAVVQEAVLVLLMLGEAAQLRLAALISRLGDLPAPVPLLASVALWDSEPALAIARRVAAEAELSPEWQFHLCLGLGDPARAIAAVRAPGTSWFRRADWDALTRAADPMTCALALTEAPHHHAYARAIALLLGALVSEPRIPDALRRFLEVSAERPIDLRRAVARRLALDHGDPTGLPILIDELIDEGAPEASLSFLTIATGTVVAHAVVDAALIGGHGACTEKRMWAVLDRLKRTALIEVAALAPLYVRILDEGSTALARRTAAQLSVGEALAHDRLEALAEVFAWGVRRGVELTGRLMRIHMTSAERDLGHTYLDQARIFVTPLPLLRKEAHGRDIVEGLILHELGHHTYHRGEEAIALWKQAHAEGIGHLLNLVADEHLERNLRAVDRSYGDRLKRLGAYAFQHATQELTIRLLLESLRGSTASALIGIELGVAFDEGAVRIRRGAILAELERTGHPLARFARALRMGLGNRFDDPRIAAALGMCGKDLRKLDMRGLYELTKRLAAMFGGSIAVARVFGGAEGLELGQNERELDVHGAGIDDEILQREVERILDPRRSGAKGSSGPRDRLQINVSPDEEFDKIGTVTRVRGDQALHRLLATEVHRHSVRLRAHLDDLGLRWEPAKARIKGHALDRGRLRSLVTRGDPRILIARTPVRRTDLFLGTIIDCSGSMQAGQNIDRAKRFGVLIAEAVRPLPGVEARFFGFTDSVIYDAGDAKDCDVTALHADGGNNDAAALLHVANLAAASAKRARVIVMISDGLPTECSVSALRGLVTMLTKRRGIVCAQVAVRRLEEQCFPNHIVLDDAEIDVAVARFGRMIGDLARKVLSS
ncbi:MAG: hypothetical protein IPQ07_27315 [Myxococcales bacterium]|nr:hypothetical protein [Myxococcales bacterium]